MKSALYSTYIIDGQLKEQTPSEMLGGAPVPGYKTIVDEACDTDEVSTRFLIAKALLNKMWSKAKFSLGDLKLRLSWTWNEAPVGNMAAFYSSVEVASEYAFDLGVGISSFHYRKGTSCTLEVSTLIRRKDRGAVPSGIAPDASSWLIYVPFGTALGADDPDYFLDCYEVVKEMVEDGILLSGVTVGDGGLTAALDRMKGKDWGMTVDLGGLESTEIPGALVQISDADFDYVDAEFLLQDVAYFPLGHPAKNRGKVDKLAAKCSGVGSIIDSLIHNCR